MPGPDNPPPLEPLTMTGSVELFHHVPVDAAMQGEISERFHFGATDGDRRTPFVVVTAESYNLGTLVIASARADDSDRADLQPHVDMEAHLPALAFPPKSDEDQAKYRRTIQATAQSALDTLIAIT